MHWYVCARIVSALLLLIAISGCTPVESDSRSSPVLVSGQPGTIALQKIQEQQLATHEEITALVTRMAKTPRFRRQLEELPDSAHGPAAELLQLLGSGETLNNATEILIGRSPDDTHQYVKAALIFFPIDRYNLFRHLQTLADSNLDRLNKWAQQSGVYVASDSPALLKEDADVYIEPLMESVSISLFKQDQDIKAAIKYREADSPNAWKQGKALIWEPVQGILTGPIVHLKAGTTYEVEITLSDNGGSNTIHRSFTTRPDSPPVDPAKVYQLREIYQGGTLDLEKLGIEGSADGWVKIVGDPNTPIVAEEGDRHAIFIGDNSYIYFENITVRGGRTHAIYSEYAHHIWINQCDISQWGRHPNIVENGIAFELEDAEPINYDSALYFRQSGVITVENCYVHDPVPGANSWESAHPKGPNAFLAHANHPEQAYKGQIILRNNRFIGAPDHRFNDVIEGRKNGESLGGFVRNSAVYNNTLAYANDDGIEIDGGQHNVLVYNNDISHTYTGVSATPARIGPSFIFNNYIHDLGDETGKQWAAFKLGGLMTGPLGQVNIFHNLVTVKRNGIAASKFQDNSTYWVHAQNNILITKNNSNMVGYSIYDPDRFTGSQYINNFVYNLALNKPKLAADITEPYVFEERQNIQNAEAAFEVGNSMLLPKCAPYVIDNFTTLTDDGKNFIYGVAE